MDSRTHMIGAFVAGTCLGTCLALALARYSLSKQRIRNWQGTPPTFSSEGIKEQARQVQGSHGTIDLASPPVQLDEADEIIREQFTRNVQFFGDEGQARVHGAFVVVVGLGGVGSHAASMLLRSGVGRLRIVDFDQVSLSSLNRHAVAVREDVGTPKALCLQRHFARIFPEAHVDARALMYDITTEEEVLAGSPDFVLDCIDNIDTKVALLAACKRRGLQVVSATGAGGRADPTRVRLADLSESTEDPLSRAVRLRLRRLHGIQDGIPVVFSTEKPKAGLLPFEAPGGVEANPADYQVVPGFRVRTIPVMGALPALFGLVMAAHVVTTLARLPVAPEPVLRLGREHYGLLHRRLIEREELRFGSGAAVDVDEDEVVYIAREMWRGRSARDQAARDVGRGMYRAMAHMCLTRWDASKPPTIDNLIMLTFEEAEAHEARTLADIASSEPQFYAMVTAVLQRARRDLAYPPRST
ncbi:NAD(P)-binding Rossmann-fold superfamily protein [Klebsormidium nitens]|uniref:NAD(P)-binding Rossmann-fold superfamily protein n=1 Tax=Klebsormidium nitens TaxID=105231 RepID=A0A1Y1HUG0_KLENI|nr:NAD(P)-binding Rossmann-fold superfamily protein [Klebsormidium nitens]|eukprot:GAQ80166.1 NAD(P)-binding Rossmann-fold superfamily protein [Klebsormidium nitens]